MVMQINQSIKSEKESLLSLLFLFPLIFFIIMNFFTKPAIVDVDIDNHLSPL